MSVPELSLSTGYWYRNSDEPIVFLVKNKNTFYLFCPKITAVDRGDQMVKKVVVASSNVSYMIQGWYYYHSIALNKPDLMSTILVHHGAPWWCKLRLLAIWGSIERKSDGESNKHHQTPPWCTLVVFSPYWAVLKFLKSETQSFFDEFFCFFFGL